MVNIIVLAILIIPWAIIPVGGIPEPTRLIKYALFDVTMFGIIFFAIKDGLLFEYKNRYLAWVVGYVFLTFIWNWYYPLIRGFGYNITLIDDSLHFILAAMATFCACSYLKRDDYVRLAKAVAFSAIAMAIFGLLQAVGLDPMNHLAKYDWREDRHVAATLDHPNLLGAFLAVCAPFLLYLKRRKYAIGFAAVLLAVLATRTSLPLIALFIATCVYVFLDNLKNRIGRVFVPVALLMFLIFALVTPAFNKFHNGFTGRIEAWQKFIEADNNYLFGHSLGVAKSYQVKVGDNWWIHCHNDYLEIFICLGFVGLFLFLLLLINTFRKFNYSQGNTLYFAYFASLIAFLILMVGSFPMKSAPIALVGLIAWWGVEKLGVKND